jgi:uncharacterized membrane protein (DUF485 family)
MENHANDANVTELNAHITHLTAKLEAMTPGTDQHAESMTLLEAYYERLLQIREMSITTATEALAEAQTTHTRRQHMFTAITIILVCYVVVVVEAYAPGQIATPIKRVCAKVASSTTLVALVSAAAAHAATRLGVI